jgi:hypothetical protein
MRPLPDLTQQQQQQQQQKIVSNGFTDIYTSSGTWAHETACMARLVHLHPLLQRRQLPVRLLLTISAGVAAV